MYTLLLSMWLKFPIGGMLQKLCKRLLIAPSQINPNTMRILQSFDETIEEKGIVREVAYMYAAYSVQKVNGDPGRVNL